VLLNLFGHTSQYIRLMFTKAQKKYAYTYRVVPAYQVCTSFSVSPE
jgi:hypothetical protein